MPRTIYSYFSVFVALTIINAHLVLSQSNYTDCSSITSCGECTSHLECGFCVTTNTCVQSGWKGPFSKPSTCPSWDYEYAQCFVTYKQAFISLTSALVGVIVFSVLLCVCCCMCRCCRIRNNDEERVPLLGDSLATHHFRRASYYNYNRNPFERKGRTLSSGTSSSAMQYGRNWRNGSDEFTYGYGGPTTPSMLWVNDNPNLTPDYSMGSHNSGLGNGEWRRWEKKREELLARYAKSGNEG